jgi:hypothetical protein
MFTGLYFLDDQVCSMYIKKLLKGLQSTDAPNRRNQDQDQDTRLRMPNKWHMCKEGKAGNKKKTTPRLACVF